jgi:hypothetical protein
MKAFTFAPLPSGLPLGPEATDRRDSLDQLLLAVQDGLHDQTVGLESRWDVDNDLFLSAVCEKMKG